MQMRRHVVFTCAMCALVAAPAFAQTKSGTTAMSPSSSSTSQQRPEGSTSSPSSIDKQGSSQSDTPTRGSSQPSTSGQYGTDRGSSARDMPTGKGSSDMSKSSGMSSDRSSGTSGHMSSQQMSSSQVRRIQEALRAQGHDPGPIDGVMGAKTQDAIKAFQSSQNLTATGQIDQQTMEKLGVGRTSARQ